MSIITSKQSIAEARPHKSVGKRVEFWTVYRMGMWVTQCAHMRGIVTEGASKADTIELCKLGVMRAISMAKDCRRSIDWTPITRKAPSDAKVTVWRVVL